MKKDTLVNVAIATGVFAMAFTATSFAATATDEGALIDLAKPVLEAVMGGRYAYAAVLALILIVALARRYGTKALPFLGTDAGGAALALVGSFAGALATTLSAGAAISGAMVWAALTIAVSAAGAFSLVKRLIVTPILRPLAAKAPGWSQPIFMLIFWIFDGGDPGAEATAAGDAAVKAKPAAGIKTPTDVA